MYSSSASNTIIGYPEFVAGLLYGLGVESDLTNIDACY